MTSTYNSPLLSHIHDLPPFDVKAFTKLRQHVDESIHRIAKIPPEKRLPREVVPCPAVIRAPLRQVTFTSGGVSGVCPSECIDSEVVVDDADDLLKFRNNMLKFAVQWPGYAAKRFTLPLPREITRGRLCQKLCVTIDNFYFTEIFSDLVPVEIPPVPYWSFEGQTGVAWSEVWLVAMVCIQEDGFWHLIFEYDRQAGDILTRSC